MGLFNDRIKNNGKTQVPTWFMRQAGRYHNHYQNIKKDSDFMTMCKNPKLAQEITHGPIDEFDFDAAILFSDLLFPLEQMGLGLKYAPGPILDKKLTSLEEIKNLKPVGTPEDFYKFQGEACKLLRESLPANKTLLGFVGAPFTLYSYSVEGSHAGALVDSKMGLYDGRFEAFYEMLLPSLITEMNIQAQNGADGMCLFDTAAGELSFSDYKKFIVPKIHHVLSEFKKNNPDTKVVYYSKMTHPHYLRELDPSLIDVLGIDWRADLASVLKEFQDEYYIQGNFDQALLHLPWPKLEEELQNFWQSLQGKGVNFDKWICGLGHGVLRTTPQENVKRAVEYIHNNFHY